MQAVPLTETTTIKKKHPDLNKQTIMELQQAFSAFTEMSEQLSDSYSQLEKRVVELSGELATVSEQRLQELNEKEQIADKLESLLRLMPAGVIVLDKRGFIVQANPAAERLINGALELEEHASLIGIAWGKIVREAFSPKQTDYHEVSLKSGKLVKLETSPLDKSGQLILLTDQTETRTLQSQVARQQRLTAMGQMVASLSHQIRTPLSAALLYAGNLKSPSLTPEKHDLFVDKLVGRLNHLERQVQDMLLFVKGECQLVNQLSVAKILSLLADSVQGLPAEVQKKIIWPRQAPSSMVQCQADALVSAFMNIINNAIEATDGQAYIHIHARSKDNEVEISFTDEGPGMDEHQLKNIQEPFFTTKSHGTGLGVPVLLTTVKAHKGSVQIKSKVGVGSQFVVTLPVMQQR
jgi:two-component system sensor histidine kinase FlrB